MSSTGDMDLLTQEFQKLSELKGIIGTLALVLHIVLQVYRVPSLQYKIPEKMRWEKLSPFSQYFCILGLAAVGGALTSFSTDLNVWDAVKAALAAVQAVILTQNISTS